VLDDDCDCIDGEVKSSSSGAAAATKGTSSSLLTLTQYRVAWYEQIILRMCQIPHTVNNSSYAARECTGALPCLLDLNYSSSGGDNSTTATTTCTVSNLDKPVYIGRNQPGGLGSYFFHQCQSSSISRSTQTSTIGSTGDDDAPPTINELHPSSWFVSSGSHIVDYLRMKHSTLMMQCVLFPEHLQQPPQQPNNCSSDAMAYETLIQDKLNYILLALRYAHDPTWESVYKQQCIRASLDPNDTSSERKRGGFFSLFAWYQTYSERALALCNLLPSRCATGGLALDLFRNNDYRRASDGNNIKKKKEGSLEQDDDTDETEDVMLHQHHPFSAMVPTYGGVGGGDSGSVNVYRAMEYADMYYTSLEQKMMVLGGGSSPTYFLGTSIPSYIDALLFSHLAEALCDVHLVLVLAKHSGLMKYFQWMYDQYFGENYVAGGGADMEWVKWNNVSNTLNAFNQIPEEAALKKKRLNGAERGSTGGMTHAITLMQQLAIHCHELDEAMRDAAAERLRGGKERVVLEKQHRPIGSTLYKWLLGIEVKLWGSKKSSKKTLSSGAGKSKTDSEEEHGDSEDAQKAMWEKHMEKVKRDRRYSDEVWISGVAVTFVGALLLSYSKSKK